MKLFKKRKQYTFWTQEKQTNEIISNDVETNKRLKPGQVHNFNFGFIKILEIKNKNIRYEQTNEKQFFHNLFNVKGDD